jgi:hypothetical protein
MNREQQRHRKLTGGADPLVRGRRPRRPLRVKWPAPLAIALLCLTAAHGEEFRLHAYHATTLSMECNVCHVPIQKDSVMLRRPGHAQCVTCHAMAFRTANNPRICQQCHVSPTSAELLAFPRLKGQLLSEFSHAHHVDSKARVDSHTGFRADCIHCHKVEAALPRHAECASCHGRAEVRPHLTAASTARDCRGCHAPEEIESPSYRQIVRTAWPNIGFSHAAHFRAEKLDCGGCHRTVLASASLTTLKLPDMLDCVGCHETNHRLGAQFRMSNCGLCHLDHPSGILPASHNNNVKPPSHNESFRVQHQEQAAASGAKCFACHSNISPDAQAGNRCASCHQVMKPVSHTARWKDDIHGRYAALDRTACATCHTADYCSRCHNELPRTHVPLALFKNGAHARLAMLDKRACLTCHTFDNTCASCHRRN